MAEKLKPLLKRIDELCTPIWKLGSSEKGIKAKDLERHYNKTPLAEITLQLLACLRDTKKHLEDQNKHIMKATSALKEQENTITDLNASLSEKDKDVASPSKIDEILKEIKENNKSINDLKASMDKRSEEIVSETKKVSSYAEILKKTTDQRQPEKLALRVLKNIKASDRKKNLIFYGVPGKWNEETQKEDYEESLHEMLEMISPRFKPVSRGVQLSSVDILKRLGSDTDRNPIFTLRVQFHLESAAARILKNAWKLKNTPHFHTYIAPDRTPAEQKQWSKLVEELKSKIEDEPTCRWMIKGQKVVKCGPWSPREESDSE